MSELPSGWVEIGRDDCVAFNPKHPADADRARRLLRPDVSRERVPGQLRPLDSPACGVCTGYTDFRYGDVIFAKITPCMENGNMPLQETRERDRGGSTEFMWRPHEDVLADYMWRCLRQISFRPDAEESMTGAVGQRRVPANLLKRQPPLPPLGEQQRIVAKIDSLSAKSKRARDHLTDAPRLVAKTQVSGTHGCVSR